MQFSARMNLTHRAFKIDALYVRYANKYIINRSLDVIVNTGHKTGGMFSVKRNGVFANNDLERIMLFSTDLAMNLHDRGLDSFYIQKCADITKTRGAIEEILYKPLLTAAKKIEENFGTDALCIDDMNITFTWNELSEAVLKGKPHPRASIELKECIFLNRFFSPGLSEKILGVLYNDQLPFVGLQRREYLFRVEEPYSKLVEMLPLNDLRKLELLEVFSKDLFGR